MFAKMMRLIKTVVMFPAMLLLGVEGEGGEPAPAGGEPAPAGGEPAPEGGTPAAGSEDEAAAAAAAEETRRAVLTPEEREAEDNAKAEAEKNKAPETYADFEAPEGITLDKAAIEEALPLFKEMNLTQEQAQRLVTLQAQNVAKANEAFAADKTSRLDAIKGDKEVGGDKYEASTEAVGRVLNSFLSPEELTDIQAYTDKFGPNPTLFKLMHRIAGRMSEDTRFEAGGQHGTQVKTVNMYPNSKMQ